MLTGGAAAIGENVNDCAVAEPAEFVAVTFTTSPLPVPASADWIV